MKKNILIIPVIILILSGCVSLPNLPELPTDCDVNKCATFKLMRANKSELGENRLGNDSIISFSDKYGIKIQKKWENFRSGFSAANAYYYFNDEAVFSVPQGTYDVQFIVPLMFESAPRISTMPNFKARAGAKYEIWLFFMNTSRNVSYDTIRITRGIKVLKIVEVKEFRDNKSNIGNGIIF